VAKQDGADNYPDEVSKLQDKKKATFQKQPLHTRSSKEMMYKPIIP